MKLYLKWLDRYDAGRARRLGRSILGTEVSREQVDYWRCTRTASSWVWTVSVAV